MRLSVVLPCKNEVATIEQVLDDLANQSLTEVFEVVIADGLSNDGTREVLARFSPVNLPYHLRVVDNPSETVSSGLNVAVAEAGGEYIVRLDAHCRVPSEYLELLMNALRKPGHDIVGPTTRYIPGAVTPVAAEIALALNTRLGNGGTPSRVNLREAVRVVHTVMGCYRREVWEVIGGYDESLLTNEDFDFDYRANLQGFSVWSLPRPQYLAVARPSIRALLRQRFRYGYWKWQVLKRHPRSLRVRQFIPLAVTAGIIMALTLSFWLPELLTLPLAYGLILCLYSANLSIRESSRPCWWRLSLIYAVIHLVWGSGFLWSMITQPMQSITAIRSIATTHNDKYGRNSERRWKILG
jgi:succinoglycan biosynthesis protein ExoA